jgi:hypothetical protein
MRRTKCVLAAAGIIAVAAVTLPAPLAYADDGARMADTAPASEDRVAATGTAGPYTTWSTCEYWRDYYAVFYNTTSCYRGEIAYWYFNYCCI